MDVADVQVRLATNRRVGEPSGLDSLFKLGGTWILDLGDLRLRGLGLGQCGRRLILCSRGRGLGRLRLLGGRLLGRFLLVEALGQGFNLGFKLLDFGIPWIRPAVARNRVFARG